MRNAGSRDGPVAKRDRPEPLLPWYCNQPVLRSGRESQYSEVSSRIDHCGTYPALMELLQGGIDCHAFRNPSEIELDTGREGYEPAYRIYLHATPSSSWLPGDYRIESDSRE